MSQGESKTRAKEQILKLRERLKGKKPRFRRQESWRYKRVTEVWRRPDGIDSKMRSNVKGWPKSVEVGYRGPKESRGLHPSGYEEVLVRNVDDLDKVNPKTQAARVAHTVGMKKRAEISVRAGEKGVRILNPLPEVKPEEEAAREEKATEAEAEKEMKVKKEEEKS